MMRIGIILLIASLLGVSVGVAYVLIEDSKNEKEFKKKRDIQDDLEFLRKWQDKYNKKHYSVEEDFDYDGPVQ